MKTVTLTLTTDEANGVLNGLAQLPYGQVAGLIAKIGQQAQQQLQEQPVNDNPSS